MNRLVRVRFFSLILILIAFGSHRIYGQTSIELKVKQSIGSKAKLYRYVGKELEVIDSCKATEDGVYRFSLLENATQGLYRFVIGKSSSFDFIVANEPEIKFESVLFAIEDSLKVVESKENKIFVEFSQIKRSSEQQQWLIGSLQNYYSEETPFAQQLRDEKRHVEFDFYHKTSSLASIDTSLFVSNYINLDTKPFVIDAIDECSYKAELAENWWTGVNLNDKRLLNTPILIKNVWDYLENSICDDRYNKEQQDSVFIAQINQLLQKPMSALVRFQIVKSLCKGFLDTDYLGVLTYLIENGGDASKVLKDDNELMARMVLEKNLEVGNNVYDFKVKPLVGRSFKLSSEKSKLKLVVFWSIWCPHCVEMMPAIQRIYSDYKAKGFEIIAVSIDDEIDQWKRFVDDKHFDWINTQVSAEYDNPIILKYNVDETPKMFLVDKNLKIVSRPASPEQLILKLKKLL
ncbi:MAG: TlpA family protein disulfide reductase [Bacteroidales bacterium]